MGKDVDEDLIEATIRRVAASKAAQTGDRSEAVEEAVEDSLPAPALHVVPAVAESDAEPEALPSRPPVDEDLIEATLRRIEAEQSARTPDVEASPAGSRLEREAAAPALQPAPDRDSGPGAGWQDVARDLRRDLEDVRAEVRSLAERVEQALASPARREPGPAAPAAATAPAQRPASDDDWDDTPQLPRVPLGAPPRPAILRDPSPNTATAAKLEEPVEMVESEARPAQPPEQRTPSPIANGRRGLDLLPRTYRITVEDKRRGVDLVPLHRALLGLDGVRDMSLLSYSNGTAIVSLETTAEIDPEPLGAAVSRAMARQVKVEVHNEQTMVIKLGED